MMATRQTCCNKKIFRTTLSHDEVAVQVNHKSVSALYIRIRDIYVMYNRNTLYQLFRENTDIKKYPNVVYSKTALI